MASYTKESGLAFFIILEYGRKQTKFKYIKGARIVSH